MQYKISKEEAQKIAMQVASATNKPIAIWYSEEYGVEIDIDRPYESIHSSVNDEKMIAFAEPVEN